MNLKLIAPYELTKDNVKIHQELLSLVQRVVYKAVIDDYAIRGLCTKHGITYVDLTGEICISQETKEEGYDYTYTKWPFGVKNAIL